MFSIASHGKTVIVHMNYAPDKRAWVSLKEEEFRQQAERLREIVSRYAVQGMEEAHGGRPWETENGIHLTKEADGFRFFCNVVPHVLPGLEAAHVYLGLPVAKKLSICMDALLGHGQAVRKRTRPAAPGAPIVRKRTRYAQNP